MRKDRCGEPEGEAQLLGDILWAIPRTYFRFTVIADQVFGAYGLIAGKRAIRRDLSVDGPRTICQLARSRPVARQYVQRLVAEMRRAGLVALKSNSAYRRTKLATLSVKGPSWPRGKRPSSLASPRDSMARSYVPPGPSWWHCGIVTPTAAKP